MTGDGRMVGEGELGRGEIDRFGIEKFIIINCTIGEC